MKNKMKKLVEEFSTIEDFQQAQKLQKKLDFMFKKSDNLRLIDAIVTFDELSNANIYRVQLLHNIDNCKEAIDCLSRSLKSICEYSVIASSGDYATRFLIVSHLSPSIFESLLTIRFNKNRGKSQFNIIF